MAIEPLDSTNPTFPNLTQQYILADNGPLDLDAAAGSITGPVGLAVSAGTATSADGLVETGANTVLVSILAVAIVALSVATRLRD